jgi:hypothetical protein
MEGIQTKVAQGCVPIRSLLSLYRPRPCGGLFAFLALERQAAKG